MTKTTIPQRVDAVLLHALCKSPNWSEAVNVGTARKIVEEQLANLDIDGAANLTPLFKYLAQAGSHGTAARCVREVAEELEAAGTASYVPELVLRRGTPRLVNVGAYDRKKPAGTHVEVNAVDKLPLVLFACFLAMILACVMLSGG